MWFPAAKTLLLLMSEVVPPGLSAGQDCNCLSSLLRVQMSSIVD